MVYDCYIGTYTFFGDKRTGSRGVYVGTVDSVTGRTQFPGVAATASGVGAAGVPVAAVACGSGTDGPGAPGPDAGVVEVGENPSFIAVQDGVKRLLWSVSEMRPRRPGEFGRLVRTELPAAGEAGAASGQLPAIAAQPLAVTGGQGPCHVAVSPDGRVITVANYGSGSVAAFAGERFPLPAADDPALPAGTGRPTAFSQHRGSGPRADRQEGPHAHSTTPTPDGAGIIVADLGTDQLVAYRYRDGAIDPVAAAVTATPAAAGPRHAVFHPDGSALYVINELSCTVSVYGYHAIDKPLQLLQDCAEPPTAACAASGVANTAADIRIHPNGRFVYASIRGENVLRCFAVQADHTLEFRRELPSGGLTPRNFALSPAGDFLLCAHQDDNRLTFFRIDAEHGTLSGGEVVAQVPCPVCVLILPHRS